MANRTVYGLQYSENHWPMVDQGSCVWVKVPGTNVTLQIREGQPAIILGAFAADFNAYVERLRDADSACWTATNSVASSNHLSGTGMDLNWNGEDGKTFRFQISKERAYPGQKAKNLDDLLEWYEGIVFCGGYWSIRDWMHMQLGANTYGSQNVEKVNDFIRRKIRPDGFSTYKRGGVTGPPVVTPPDANQGGLTAENLAKAMGNAVTMDRYRALLPGIRAAMVQAKVAGNLNRSAMWLAQLGHESGGLRYMEEIASGKAYEGRADLGNTQPGDGVRFKGHGPIQITGRHNHTAVSKWAFENGYVPTPTYFVDKPQELASDKYGFLGAVWYWTVARPNINGMCDAKDLNGVTRAINGGLNGIDDRRTRWDRCLGMGLAALNVTGGITPPAQGDDELADPDVVRKIDAIYTEVTKRFESRSPFRHVNEGPIDTAAGFVLNGDGHGHVQLVIKLAQYGDKDAIALLKEVAANTDPARKHDAQFASAVLAETAAPVGPSVSDYEYGPDFVNARLSVDVPQATVVQEPAQPPQVYVSPASVPTPLAETDGQVIGRAFDALSALQDRGVLNNSASAPLVSALISVLQTKVEPEEDAS